MEAPLICLRAAQFDDWPLLLDWFNQPDSLAAKLKTNGPIGVEAHKGWLRRFLSEDAGSIFIVTLNETPIGQIRFQPDAKGQFEIDVYVIPGRRGDGVAQEALRLGMARVSEKRGPATFLAQVKTENDASRRLFLRLGFQKAGSWGGYTNYRRDLDAQDLAERAGQA